MTEREILKKLVDLWQSDDGDFAVFGDLGRLAKEARKLLAETEPKPPDHPAVVAYREWAHSKLGCVTTTGQVFLAGWKRALEHIADNFDDSAFMQCDVRRHLLAASNATPERLP